MGKVADKIRVISPEELDEDTKARIERTFSAKHKNRTVFSYEKDGTLIGGILIIDGDNYYNSSVRGKLDKIKSLL